MEDITLNDEFVKDFEGLELEKGKVQLGEALQYLLGGKCIATFVNKTKDSHITFLCRTASKKYRNLFWVYALTGKNNTRDYSFFGFIKLVNNKFIYEYASQEALDRLNADFESRGVNLKYKFAKLAKISEETVSAKSFAAIWEIISNRGYLQVKNESNVITTDINAAKRFNNIKEAEQYIKTWNLQQCIISPVSIYGKPVFVIHKTINTTNLEMWHSSHCCRCGRVLTVDKSVKAGFGPYCAKQMLAGK